MSLLACGSNPGREGRAGAELDSELADTSSEADAGASDASGGTDASSDVAIEDSIDSDDDAGSLADAAQDGSIAADVAEDVEPDASDAGDDLDVEDCGNGLDDDGDGAVDDEDDDCAEVRVCELIGNACEAGDISCWDEDRSSDCNNGSDDDEDGLADCDDPDCAEDVACNPLPCVNGECSPGEQCNRWNGRCEADSSAYPPEGADIGGACVSDDACRSVGHAGGRLNPVCNTGWEGGYCMGFCTTCHDHWTGQRLPRRECASGSVCLPNFGEDSRGACVQECTNDDDCRSEGTFQSYYCRREFWVDGETLAFENGYCAPMHCQSRGCSGWSCGC